MKKIIAAFLGISALTIALLLNQPEDIFAFNGNKVNAESSDLGALSNQSAEEEYQSMTLVFEQAGNEIQDANLAAFYSELISESGLDRTFESEEEEFRYLADNLPDINRTCIFLPLQAAGRTIEDDNISSFYNRFVSGLGAE